MGIKRAPSQDENDPRPYLQFVLFAVLLGGDSQHFDIVADGFGFDEKVCIVLNKDYSYFSIKSFIIPSLCHKRIIIIITIIKSFILRYPDTTSLITKKLALYIYY